MVLERRGSRHSWYSTLHSKGKFAIGYEVVMAGDTCGADIGEFGIAPDFVEKWILVHRGV